jgi:hypothetical protein
MGEKDKSKLFFIGDKEVEISGIPEFPGDLIECSLRSVEKEDNLLLCDGKAVKLEMKHALSNKILYSLIFPNRINQNNFRRMHGIPMIRRVAGRKGVRKKEH